MFVSAHHRKVEPPPSGIIRTGLQSRWPMDEGSGTNVGDDQGPNDGVMQGMDENAWVPGIGIGPYSLDFLNSYSVPRVSCGIVDPASTTALSICARIQPRTHTSECVISNGHSAGLASYIYRIMIISTSVVRFLLGNVSGTSWGLVFDAAMAVPTGTPSHIAFTWNGALAIGYLNGIEEDTDNYSGTLKATATQPLMLGNVSDPTTTHRFNGILDDIRVYSRDLTPAEVLSISNGTG